MPDIDLDFQDDRRADMMEYCNEKYGADKVAQIITFGTLGARRHPRRGAGDEYSAFGGGPGGEDYPWSRRENPSIAETLEKSPELRAVYRIQRPDEKAD